MRSPKLSFQSPNIPTRKRLQRQSGVPAADEDEFDADDDDEDDDDPAAGIDLETSVISR